MSWEQAFGLLRLLSEEKVGHPSREAEQLDEQRRIDEMQQRVRET